MFQGMRLSPTHQAIADLRKGETLTLANGVNVTRLSRRADPFDHFLLEGGGVHELCYTCSTAASRASRNELYQERYVAERSRIEAAEIAPPKPDWARLVDWASALSDEELQEAHDRARARLARRGDGSARLPFRAGNEFSDPAKLDAATDTDYNACQTELARREAALEKRIGAVAPAGRPSRPGRPSGLALGLDRVAA